MPRAGDLVGGKYRVERLIARGGMGAVFVAVHEVTGGRVALKWLVTDPHGDAEATHRLIREARAAARIRHPNVVTVYDVGDHAGSLFLVMELLEGETLASLLNRQGSLSLPETLELMWPTMRAVAAAHRCHVIHRDLKPSNVFLNVDETHTQRTPRVLDFGVSKLIATPEDPEFSLTQTGAVMGTPFYMAPEQLHGKDIDERVDIYALGVMLYQVLSGRLPFYDPNYNALVVQIATATPVALRELRPDLPRAVCTVIEKAMARERETRHRNMDSLICELVEASNFRASAPGRAPRVRPVAKRSLHARNVTLWLSGFFVLAAISGYLWVRATTTPLPPVPAGAHIATPAPAAPDSVNDPTDPL